MPISHSSKALIATVLLAPVAFSQRPARRLEAAKDLSENGFSILGGVRELPNGQLLTLDVKEQTLGVLDPKTGQVKAVGRTGEGPGEYRRPAFFVSFGDTTLVADIALRRFLVVDELGRATGATSPAWGGNGDVTFGLPAAVDRARRAYALLSAISMVNGRPTQLDSTYIARVATGAQRVDTLVRLALPKTAIRAQSDKNGNVTSMNIVRPPITGADDWVVLGDGRVAVVRGSPYRVDWVAPTGKVTVGPSLPFGSRSLSDADKQSVLVARAAASGAVTQPGSPEDFEWPASAPPFNGTSSLADPSGRVWIRRFRFASDAATRYDVVGGDGRLLFQAEVPGMGRVVGFGRDQVYFTRVDDDGLQYLRRAALPR